MFIILNFLLGVLDSTHRCCNNVTLQKWTTKKDYI